MSFIFELIEAIGLSGTDIIRIINTAPARYRVYPIAKRNGGERIIAQPSRELKAIQRFILEEKLSRFPVHQCAMAYEKKRSIYENALAHKNANAILKLDFRNFFPSIKVKDWEAFVTDSQTDLIAAGEIKLYSKILFWGEQTGSTVPRCLSIGAPSSPMVSNILMYDFDVALSGMASELGLSYTRYADDVTISGSGTEEIRKLEQIARKFVRQMKSPRLGFNEQKRGLYTKGQRRMVTGLVLTPTRTISIGRERKRKISSLLHRSSLDQLDLEQRSLLKGLLGFCAANEPEFLGRLRQKYGSGILDAAMKFHAPLRAAINPPAPLED